jgi:phenylacetic acid degradation operon negative regulatory protein
MKTSEKAEDFLALLCFALEKILSPSPHNILKTFEAWDYEHRLRPQLRCLERNRLIERHRAGGAIRYRLSPKGRLATWGGSDPNERWWRAWDGQWRIVLFDLPASRPNTRFRLWRWLREHHFGYLQNSVWITPDPVNPELLPLKSMEAGAEVLLVLAAQPGPTFSQAAIVAAAWDFSKINQAYQAYLEVLAEAADFMEEASTPGPARVRVWLAREREAWLNAVQDDPLLPSPLHPAGYLGVAAWSRRQQVLIQLTLTFHGKEK